MPLGRDTTTQYWVEADNEGFITDGRIVSGEGSPVGSVVVVQLSSKVPGSFVLSVYRPNVTGVAAVNASPWITMSERTPAPVVVKAVPRKAELVEFIS